MERESESDRGLEEWRAVVADTCVPVKKSEQLHRVDKETAAVLRGSEGGRRIRLKCNYYYYFSNLADALIQSNLQLLQST